MVVLHGAAWPTVQMTSSDLQDLHRTAQPLPIDLAQGGYFRRGAVCPGSLSPSHEEPDTMESRGGGTS